MVFVLGTVFVGPGDVVAQIVLCFLAGKGEGVSVFEVEGGKLETVVSLPDSKSYDVFELFFCEEDIEDTLEHNIFTSDLIIFLLDELSFFFVLVLHLEDFLGGCFVLLPEVVE